MGIRSLVLSLGAVAWALVGCAGEDSRSAARSCWIDTDGRTICVVDDGGPGGGDASGCDGGPGPGDGGGGDAMDAGDAGDAGDAMDAMDAGDAMDAMDAGDAGDAMDAMDAGDGDGGMDAGDGDGGMDAGDGDGGMDAGDGDGGTDAGDGDGGLDGGSDGDGGLDGGSDGDGGLDGGDGDGGLGDAGVDALPDGGPDGGGSCGNGVCEYTVDNTGTCPTVTRGSETPQNCPSDCNCCDYSIDICGQFGNGTCDYDELQTSCTGRRTWCAWGPDHVSDCCGDGYCDVDTKHALYPDRPSCGAASGPPTHDRGRNNCEADRPLREQTGEDLINCPNDCPCEGANGWDSGADGVCQFCNGALGESCDYGAQDWGADGVPKTCDDTCVDDSGASDFDGRSRRWERAGQCSDCDPCTDGYDPNGQFNNARWGHGAPTEGAGCDHRVDCDGNYSGWCAWGPDSYPDCWDDSRETADTAARGFGFCDPDVVHVRGSGRGQYLFADPDGNAVWASSCPGPMQTSMYTVVAGENVYNGYARGFLGTTGPYRDAPEWFSFDCCGFDPDGDGEPEPTPHQGDGFEPTDDCDGGTCVDPPDAGPDAYPDAYPDAGWDAGPDAYPDAGWDGGPPDGGVGDGGTDGGPSDGGMDAGLPDGGDGDGGMDGGPSDGGVDGGDGDGGMDGGPSDGGIDGDAGDGGPSDGGPDADARDAGPDADAGDAGPDADAGDGGPSDGGPSHCSPVTVDAIAAKPGEAPVDGGCGCGAGGDRGGAVALAAAVAAVLTRRRRRAGCKETP